jgi:kynurenine 3-monooxygenase
VIRPGRLQLTQIDLRTAEVTSNISQSINLALSERGINSLRKTGLSDLADAVLADTFPMHGRMIHVRKQGQYVRQAQAYDAHGRVSTLAVFDGTGANK